MRTVLSCSTILAVSVTTLLASGVAHAQSPVGGGDGETTGAAPAGTPATAAPVTTVEAPPGESDFDVAEKEHKTYYFVGARYRGTVIPKFMVNIFVDEGATFYSNMTGIEFEIRKDHFSLIPALNFVEYGFDPTLFFDKTGKNGAANEGNWTVVHSNLKGIYLTLDLLWSTPIQKHIDFEYGIGVGVGAIFGNIYNDWATKSAPGGNTAITHATASDGSVYYECQTPGPAGSGCDPNSHTTKDPAKVNGYSEKTWASGGSIPNVFLHLALPQLGFRFKPVKQFAGRIGFGFSLTGFFFGISGDYGLPESSEKPKSAASR